MRARKMIRTKAVEARKAEILDLVPADWAQTPGRGLLFGGQNRLTQDMVREGLVELRYDPGKAAWEWRRAPAPAGAASGGGQ